MDIETESRSNQAESHIALATKAVLGIVLAASLIAGGRQLISTSAGPGYGASKIVIAPRLSPPSQR